MVKYLSDGILTAVNSMAEVDESNSVPDYLEELKQAILINSMKLLAFKRM